ARTRTNTSPGPILGTSTVSICRFSLPYKTAAVICCVTLVFTFEAALRSSMILRQDAMPARFQHEYRLMNIGGKPVLRQGELRKKPDSPILFAGPPTRYRSRTARVLPCKYRRPKLQFAPGAKFARTTECAPPDARSPRLV